MSRMGVWWLGGIALGYGLNDRGFESRQEPGIFLLTTASRQPLGPTHPPIQWVPGALFLWVKRLGREADHSPPSTRVYLKVSGLAAWGENCKWYSPLPLRAVVSPFCESVYSVLLLDECLLFLFISLPNQSENFGYTLVVPRSRMRGAMPPLSDTASWRGA
jgi:hypothetical protein